MSKILQILNIPGTIDGTTYRPPVRLVDTIDTVAPTGPSAIIDGMTVNNGDRVLFTNLVSVTDANKVFKASGVGTSIVWTLETDAHDMGVAEDGDQIFVQQGTVFANTFWFFDGTAWHLRTFNIPLQQNLIFNPDNTFDIGTLTSGRPRDLYVGRDLYMGRNIIADTDALSTIGSPSARFLGLYLSKEARIGSTSQYSSITSALWVGSHPNITARIGSDSTDGFMGFIQNGSEVGFRQDLTALNLKFLTGSNLSMLLDAGGQLSLYGSEALLLWNKQSGGNLAYMGFDFRNDGRMRLAIMDPSVKSFMFNLGGGDSTMIETGVTVTTGNTMNGNPTITNVPAGVTAGLSPGQLIYGTGIPFYATVQSVGPTTILMSVPATANGSGVALTITDEQYGHWTFSQPFSRLGTDAAVINIYAPNNNTSSLGSGPHLLLHNNDPLHTPGGLISIVMMNDDSITGGVPVGGLDWRVENHSTEGLQSGSGYFYTVGAGARHVLFQMGSDGTVTIGEIGGPQTHLVYGALALQAPKLQLNFSGSNGTAIGAGLEVQRSSTHGSLIFDPSSPSFWKAGLLGSESPIVTAATIGGLAFLQGGDSFGATAVLGTNDNHGLNFLANGSVIGSYSNAGAWTLGASGGAQNHFVNGDLFVQQNGGGALVLKDTTNVFGAGMQALLDFQDMTGAGGGYVGYDHPAQTHFRVYAGTGQLLVFGTNGGGDQMALVSTNLTIGTASNLGYKLGVVSPNPALTPNSGGHLGLKNSDPTNGNVTTASFLNSFNVTSASIDAFNVVNASGGTQSGALGFNTVNAGSLAQNGYLSELGVWTLGSTSNVLSHQIFGSMQIGPGASSSHSFIAISNGFQDHVSLFLNQNHSGGGATFALKTRGTAPTQLQFAFGPVSYNQDGDTGFTTFGSLSSVGAWNLGAVGGSQTHTVNGALLVNSTGGFGNFIRPDAAGNALTLGNGANYSFGDWNFKDTLGSNVNMTITSLGQLTVGRTGGSLFHQVNGRLILTSGSGSDINMLQIFAATTTALSRQVFWNSDSSRSFEFDANFASGTESFIIQSDIAQIILGARDGSLTLGNNLSNTHTLNGSWNMVNGQFTFLRQVDDGIPVALLANTSVGTVRQEFHNAGNTRRFQLVASFTSGSEIFNIQSDIAGIVVFTRAGLIQVQQDGSASLPVLSSFSEPNSGIYRAGSHDWRFSINGSDVLKWAAAGVSVFGLLNVSSLTPSMVVVSDGSDNLASSSVTSASLAYLNNAEGLQTVTLTDNAPSPVILETWALANFTNVIIDYSITRPSGNVESGSMRIIYNGTTVAYDNGDIASSGDVGVTLSADSSAGNLRLLYTTTSTGQNATMKYTVRKWLA